MAYLTNNFGKDLASRLDEFALRGIFQTGSNGMQLWVALGLSQVIPAGPTEVLRNLKIKTFNNIVRVFWVYQLFDTVAYHSGFAASQRPYLPHSDSMAKLRANAPTNTVRPTNYLLCSGHPESYFARAYV